MSGSTSVQDRVVTFRDIEGGGGIGGLAGLGGAVRHGLDGSGLPAVRSGDTPLRVTAADLREAQRATVRATSLVVAVLLVASVVSLLLATVLVGWLTG